MRLDPGTRLGSYEIVGLLGAGGMGQVYRALDLKLERHVAIKVLAGSLDGQPRRSDFSRRPAPPPRSTIPISAPFTRSKRRPTANSIS